MDSKVVCNSKGKKTGRAGTWERGDPVQLS